MNFEVGYTLFKEGDYNKAIHYFRMGARYHNDISCKSYLAYCHEMGYGTPKDQHSALLWYRKVANSYKYRRDKREWEDSWIRKRHDAIAALNPQPIVRFPVIVDDYKIGRVVISIDSKPSSIRIKDGCAYVNASAHTPYDAFVGNVASLINNRAAQRSISIPEVINENSHADYEHFKLRFKRGEGSRYTHSKEGVCYTIIVPQDTTFEHLVVRETLVNYAKRMMKDAAESYLTSRMEYLSQRTGLSYGSCSVKSLNNAWGLYSRNNKHIDLHTELILHDSLAIDAVILHELCHTISFKHDKKFYDALLQYGGREIYQADMKISSQSLYLTINP